MLRLALLVSLIACSSPQNPPTTSVPPGASPDLVVDTLHGVAVRDHHRWMETAGPRFDAFLDEQGRRARRVLSALPGRDRLRDAIRAANRGVTRVQVRGVAGGVAQPRVFVTRQAPNDDTSQLYVRDGWDGADRLLVDPRTRNAGATHYALDHVAPSPDGKYVAYGISASGSEDSTIEILEVDTRKVRAEKIDRAQYAMIDWRDATSFFYWRRRKPEPTDTRADWFKRSGVYLHVLGDDPEQAVPVFGAAVEELGLAPESFSWISVSPRSTWALGAVSPGATGDMEYFVAPVKAVTPGAKVPWRRISGPKDGIGWMLQRDDTIYALTHGGAPRYRLLAFDAKVGTLATGREIVPEGEAVIEWLAGADDAIYLQLLDGGVTRIDRVSWDGQRRETLPLPFVGSAFLTADGARPGIWFTAEGWTQPRRTYAYDPKAGVRDLRLADPWPTSYAHLVSREVEVASADGTHVPLSIIHHRDAKLDGSLPALLGGYQAYGIIERPEFKPMSLVWAERGVYAVCHGRGGGERGKQWHLAGTKHNKENGVDDFIACSEYLVANKYTTASKLAATGGSAGGILVGGAITKRPDLYAVALLRVPAMNLVRFETTAGGPANIPEFGALADPVDFKHILASDPYHRVRDGTKYPAIVLTGGRNDVRVPIWMPAKFAARIQSASTSGKPILLRVESDAGHGLGSTRTQIEEELADLFAFALHHTGVAL